MPTKRHLPFTHIIHAAGGQSNSALSQNFVHLESSARVHAADRAMRQSKYTWHRLVEKSACRRKFFIQHRFICLVTMSFRKAFTSRRLSHCGRRLCDPLVTGIALERSAVDDVQVPLSGDTTAPLRLARTSSDDHNGGAASAAVAQVKRLTCSWSMLPGLSDSPIVPLA
jgi:hypothetical protein